MKRRISNLTVPHDILVAVKGLS